MFYAITEGRRTAVAVGGPPRSGKSVIARQAAARLTRAKPGKQPGWAVVAVASRSHELPDRHEALEVGRHALALADIAAGQKVLLVLEDLQPVGPGDTDAVLPFVAEGLDVSVLALLQVNANSPNDWKTDRVLVVPAIVGRVALREFVRRIAETYPAEADSGPALTLLRGDHWIPDLRRLCEVMRRDTASTTSTLAGIPPSAYGALAMAAAMTLCRCPVPAEILGGVNRQTRDAVGVIPGNEQGTLTLAGWDICHELIALNAHDPGAAAVTQRGRGVTMVDRMVALLLPPFEAALRSGSAKPLQIMRGALLYRASLCAELLRQANQSGALAAWAAHADSVTLAQSLLSVGAALDEEGSWLLVHDFLHGLRPTDAQPDLHSVVVIERCLQQYLSRADEVQFRKVLTWLLWAASQVLDSQSGSPDERYQFLRRLLRYHEPLLNDLVANRVVEIFSDLDPLRTEDYLLVRRAYKLQLRANRNVQEESASFPIDQEHPVQALIKHEPERTGGIGLYVAVMLLRMLFRYEQWDPMFDRYQHHFEPAVNYTSARNLAHALRELQDYRTPLSTFVVNKWQGLVEAVQSILFQTTVTADTADLLRVIADIHARKAYEILYHRNGDPRSDLAQRIAYNIRKTKDAKGAGMLISACSEIDDLFRAAEDSFASQLAENLTEKWVLMILATDPRPSIKYYLVRGLWDANARYRHRCLDKIHEMVCENLLRSPRPWAAKLAMQVGSDPDFGIPFLLGLRASLRSEDILTAITENRSVETYGELQGLGRVLFGDIASGYLQRFDEGDFVERLAAASPGVVAETCRQTARTLAAADVPGAARQIARLADRTHLLPEGAWAWRLERTKTPEEFAQAANILRELDPDMAREAITELAARKSVTSYGNEPTGVLLAMLRRAVFESATGACAMLGAIDRSSPGTGKQLYEDLSQQPLLPHALTEEIRQLQNPVAQASAARHLARIGLLPGSPRDAWIGKVFETRRKTAGFLRSPRSIVEQLRMLAVWDPEFAHTFVGDLSFTNVKARLSAGLSKDIASAVEFASILDELGCWPLAIEVCEVLTSLDAPRLVRFAGLDAMPLSLS